MQQNNIAKNVLNIIVALIPLGYLAYKWSDLPSEVPLNYGLDGSVKSVGTKTEFLLVIIFMCVVSIGVYFLLTNIHKIDPKRTKEGKSAVFDKLALGVVFFMTAICIVIIQQPTHPEVNYFNYGIVPLLGLLFAFFGNLMYNIKPNYFAGIRLPWTLSDDENWRKTHRLGGALWFLGGICILISAITTTKAYNPIVLFIIILCMTIVPIIYSFILFKQKQNSTN